MHEPHDPPTREEEKMKYILIAILSSPLLLAYELKPIAMQEALGQLLHFLLQRITS
jgi:hypothetical protein